MINNTRKIFSVVRLYSLFIIISLIWFMVQFLRFVFPPLFDTFQSVYQVSNTATGLLFTLLLLGYASAQFPAGLLGDRLGHSKVILGSTILFSGASLLIVLSPMYAFIIFFATIIGIGTGPHKTIAIPLLTRKYPENNGRALGIMDTFGQFGGMTAPIVVGFFISVNFWQGTFVFAAAICGILIILFYYVTMYKSTTQLTEPKRVNDSSDAEKYGIYSDVFANRNLLIFVFVTICFTFTWNAITSFLPIFLITEKGLTTEFAGLLYSLLFVMSVSQPATGELADRVGSLSVGAWLFIILVIGKLSLLVMDSLVTMFFATVLMGLGLHGFRPIRDTYLMKLIPDSVAGGTLGLIRTFMTGIGALAPVCVGFISDIAGFPVSFIFVTTIGLFALILILSLKYKFNAES